MKLAVLLSLVCTLGVSAVVLAPGAGAVTGETGICSFPISSDQTLHGNPTDAAHFPPSGPFPGVFTGQFFVTITNDTNGHSIEVNASGPGFEPAAGGSSFQAFRSGSYPLPPPATSLAPGYSSRTGL